MLDCTKGDAYAFIGILKNACKVIEERWKKNQLKSSDRLSYEPQGDVIAVRPNEESREPKPERQTKRCMSSFMILRQKAMTDAVHIRTRRVLTPKKTRCIRRHRHGCKPGPDYADCASTRCDICIGVHMSGAHALKVNLQPAQKSQMSQRQFLTCFAGVAATMPLATHAFTFDMNDTEAEIILKKTKYNDAAGSGHSAHSIMCRHNGVYN